VSSYYYPTYGLREDLDPSDASWLADQQGHGPLELADITDVCATLGVRADLRDEVGFLIGRVDAKGDYHPLRGG
jgi:hypothetical protein